MLLLGLYMIVTSRRRDPIMAREGDVIEAPAPAEEAHGTA
jgi:hypothetical protein